MSKRQSRTRQALLHREKLADEAYSDMVELAGREWDRRTEAKARLDAAVAPYIEATKRRKANRKARIGPPWSLAFLRHGVKGYGNWYELQSMRDSTWNPHRLPCPARFWSEEEVRAFAGLVVLGYMRRKVWWHELAVRYGYPGTRVYIFETEPVFTANEEFWFRFYERQWRLPHQ